MKKKIDFIKSANNFSFNPFSEVASYLSLTHSTFYFKLNNEEKMKGKS